MFDESSVVRKPPGSSEGGEFANKPHNEAGQLDLRSSADREERRRALASDGFVPAAATPTDLSPRTTARREMWWDRSWTTAEYGHKDGDYPQMPDDNTPNHKSGQALSGERRTHRMKYMGPDVTMRMPSQRAANRFADEVGGTFDMPVSLETPDGNVHGWVRVTRNGQRDWDTQALGFSGDNETYAAEAVKCVLESRRPRTAIAESGLMIQRRKETAKQAGAEMQPLTHSSWVKAAGFDDETGTLTVNLNGRDYSYESDRETFEKLVNSESPGKTYNALVKKQAERVESSRCQNCGRFMRGSHECPPKTTSRSDVRVDNRDRYRDAATLHVAAAPSNPVSTADWSRNQWKASQGTADLKSPPSFGPKRGFTATPELAQHLDKYADLSRATTSVPLSGVSGQDAIEIGRRLPSKNLSHRENGGPTTSNMLRVAAQSDGKFVLTGKMVPPSSPKERVAFDGVYMRSDTTDGNKAAFEAASSGLKPAQPPTVMERRVVPGTNEEGWFIGW